MASVSAVKSLLVDTTMPQGMIDDSLDQASALWLMSAPADQLASDLVLCHPPLGADELRAAAHRLDGGGTRLTVVTDGRPDALAATAAVLAAEELAISSASAMRWGRLDLHAVTIPDLELSERRWAELTGRLKGLATEPPPQVTFEPIGEATVTASPAAMGRCVVTVSAPDQRGLLWAICRWFADQDVSVEAACVDSERAPAHDDFVVLGQPDVSRLAAHLSRSPQDVPLPEVVLEAVGAGWDLAGKVLRLFAGNN